MRRLGLLYSGGSQAVVVVVVVVVVEVNWDPDWIKNNVQKRSLQKDFFIWTKVLDSEIVLLLQTSSQEYQLVTQLGFNNAWTRLP